MHFSLCHPAEAHGTHVTRTLYFTGQECTLVYVTPLKPMSLGHCALCFISHGYCALLYKSSLYVTPLMAGGVLLPHPSISSSLCNQPGLHCCTALRNNCTFAHRAETFRYLLHQTKPHMCKCRLQRPQSKGYCGAAMNFNCLWATTRQCTLRITEREGSTTTTKSIFSHLLCARHSIGNRQKV